MTWRYNLEELYIIITYTIERERELRTSRLKRKGNELAQSVLNMETETQRD